MSKSSFSSVHRLLLLTIILVGFSLRVGALNASSLWLDELIQMQLASLPLAKLPAAMFAHANVPVDILITKVLLKLGEQDGWLRLSSAFAGTLSLPLIYLVARKLVTAPVPMLAMAMLAFSPLAIQYNREIRPYSTFLMLALLSTYLYLKALEKPRYWLGFVPALLATLHTHLFAIALFPVYGLYWLLWYLKALWRAGRKWSLLLSPLMLAAVLVIFVLSPLSPNYLARFSGAILQGLGGPRAVESLSLAETAYPFPGAIFLLKRLPIDFTSVFPTNFQGQVLALIGLVLVVIGIVSLRRRPRALSFLLLWLFLIPVIIIFTLYQRDHWFSPRYIIHALPAMLILVATGIAQIGTWIGALIQPKENATSPSVTRTVGATISALILLTYLALAAPSLSTAFYTPHENLRDASAWLAEEYDPDTLVVAPLLGNYLYHYLPRDIPILDTHSGGLVEAEAQNYKRLLIVQTIYSRLQYPDAPWINPENAVASFHPGVVIYRGPAGEMAKIRLAERRDRTDLSDPDVKLSAADLRQIANDARSTQDWDMAVSALERVLEQTPNDAGLWSELGFARQMQKAYPQAIAAYEQSLAHNPDQPWAHLLLANSYRWNGQADLGLPHAETAVAMSPDLPNAWTTLGNTQLALGNAGLARESFAKGLALRPDDLELRYGDAQAASLIDETQARQIWLDLLALNPPAYMVETACTHLDSTAHPACQKQP